MPDTCPIMTMLNARSPLASTGTTSDTPMNAACRQRLR
jgi:hypothetical protein